MLSLFHDLFVTLFRNAREAFSDLSLHTWYRLSCHAHVTINAKDSIDRAGAPAARRRGIRACEGAGWRLGPVRGVATGSGPAFRVPFGLFASRWRSSSIAAFCSSKSS